MHGDPRLVAQLVANLVDNATRYNHPGGWIEISCSIGGPGGRAVLTVDNSGPVVPAHELDRLFEPFHRVGTDRTSHTDGHGLGLSIVQAIATAHNAEISVQAHRRGGLHITVAF